MLFWLELISKKVWSLEKNKESLKLFWTNAMPLGGQCVPVGRGANWSRWSPLREDWISNARVCLRWSLAGQHTSSDMSLVRVMTVSWLITNVH